MKKWLIVRVALALLIVLAACHLTAASAENTFVNRVVVYSENRGFGKEATSIIISLDDTSDFRILTADDYTLDGVMIDKRAGKNTMMHPVAVDYTDTDIILQVDPFIVESSYRKFAFTCTDERLNFVYSDIAGNICLNVDAFTDEQTTIGDRVVQYHLYSPESDVPLPVVIYNHGGGCTGFEGVLTDDCFASAWITGDAQQEFPCYVVAPFRASVKDDSLNAEDEMDAVKAIVDGLISEGKVDPRRVYMGGESMGCLFTISFCNRYPGYLAAAILMDGGPFEIQEGADLEDTVNLSLSSPWSEEELQRLASSGTSVNIVQGVGDTLSIPIRLATIYRKLLALGMEDGRDVVWTPYSADKFNDLLRSVTKIYHIGKDEPASAVDPITGEVTWQDGLFHNTSRVTAWDPAVRTWLAEQIRP